MRRWQLPNVQQLLLHLLQLMLTERLRLGRRCRRRAGVAVPRLCVERHIAQTGELVAALRANDPNAFKCWLSGELQNLGEPVVAE